MKRLVFGLILATVALLVGRGAPVHAKKLARLKDRCSGDVIVKAAWAEDIVFALHKDDIVLARGLSLCNLVVGSAGQPPMLKGVCELSFEKYSKWTDPIPYADVQKADGSFWWFCGETVERSRCPEGTKHVRFLIGPDRLFETQCLD
jgi:hypothetical protein